MWLGQKHKACSKKGLVRKPGAPLQRARVSRGCPEIEGLEGCPGTGPFSSWDLEKAESLTLPFPWDVHRAGIATSTPPHSTSEAFPSQEMEQNVS